MKRILVCLDGSVRAPKVLANAIHLAERLGARLTLFRSVGLPSMDDENAASVASPEGLKEQMFDHARRELTAASQDVPAGLLAGIEVVVGVPWDAICTRSTDVDLVIIGSHGYAGLDRILGTTAAKVVNHALASVLVVR